MEALEPLPPFFVRWEDNRLTEATWSRFDLLRGLSQSNHRTKSPPLLAKWQSFDPEKRGRETSLAIDDDLLIGRRDLTANKERSGRGYARLTHADYQALLADTKGGPFPILKWAPLPETDRHAVLSFEGIWHLRDSDSDDDRAAWRQILTDLAGRCTVRPETDFPPLPPREVDQHGPTQEEGEDFIIAPEVQIAGTGESRPLALPDPDGERSKWRAGRAGCLVAGVLAVGALAALLAQIL